MFNYRLNICPCVACPSSPSSSVPSSSAGPSPSAFPRRRSSGTHTPGASAGIQTFQSELTYNAGSSIAWELVSNTDDATGSRGTDFDGIDLAGGTLIFNNTTTLDFNFGGTVDFNDAFWSTTGLTRNWTIFSGASSVVGSVPGDLVFNPNGAATPSGGSFALCESGNDVFLSYTFTAIPEPTSAMMLGSGLLAIGMGPRRRRCQV